MKEKLNNNTVIVGIGGAALSGASLREMLKPSPIVDWQGKPLNSLAAPTINPSTQLKVEKGPTAKEIRAKKQHEICEKKLHSLVLEYFAIAKDDSLGAEHHYKRFNNQWKVFATIKNKQQRDIKIHLNAFEENIKTFLEHAERQLREQREATSKNAIAEQSKWFFQKK